MPRGRVRTGCKQAHHSEGSRKLPPQYSVEGGHNEDGGADQPPYIACDELSGVSGQSALARFDVETFQVLANVLAETVDRSIPVHGILIESLEQNRVDVPAQST